MTRGGKGHTVRKGGVWNPNLVWLGSGSCRMFPLPSSCPLPWPSCSATSLLPTSSIANTASATSVFKILWSSFHRPSKDHGVGSNCRRTKCLPCLAWHFKASFTRPMQLTAPTAMQVTSLRATFLSANVMIRLCTRPHTDLCLLGCF